MAAVVVAAAMLAWVLALAVAKTITAAPRPTLINRAVSRGRRLHHPPPRRRQCDQLVRLGPHLHDQSKREGVAG